MGRHTETTDFLPVRTVHKIERALHGNDWLSDCPTDGFVVFYGRHAAELGNNHDDELQQAVKAVQAYYLARGKRNAQAAVVQVRDADADAESAWANLAHAPQLHHAIEVALAGHHSLRIIGPVQAGKPDLERLVDTTHGVVVPALLWTMPCPCGFTGEPRHKCTCSPEHALRWADRLRHHHWPINVRVQIPDVRALKRVDLARAGKGESFAAVLARAKAASEFRLMVSVDLDLAGSQLLDAATDKLRFGPAERDSVFAVARTCAALAGSVSIRACHLAEAIHYVYVP